MPPSPIKIRQAPARQPYQISLPGEHQKINAALALATVEVLQNQIPVTEEQIRAGLAGVSWPGRLQLVTGKSGQKILLDGAHNPAGAKALREALEKNFPAAKRTLVLGVLQDKDWRPICETLAPLAARIHTVPVASERSAHPQELAEACRKINPAAEISVGHSLGEATGKIRRRRIRRHHRLALPGGRGAGTAGPLPGRRRRTRSERMDGCVPGAPSQISSNQVNTKQPLYLLTFY